MANTATASRAAAPAAISLLRVLARRLGSGRVALVVWGAGSTSIGAGLVFFGFRGGGGVVSAESSSLSSTCGADFFVRFFGFGAGVADVAGAGVAACADFNFFAFFVGGAAASSSDSAFRFPPGFSLRQSAAASFLTIARASFAPATSSAHVHSHPTLLLAHFKHATDASCA